MQREPKIFVVIGGRGTGKTYFLEHLLHPGNTLVIELVKTNRWQGYQKVFYDDFETGSLSYKDIANKKIVFEDATSYISSNMKNDLKKLIINSKQLGCDVYIVLHSLNIIPPFLYNLLNYIILFRCAKPRQNAHNYDYYAEIMTKWKKLERSKPYKFDTIESKI